MKLDCKFDFCLDSDCGTKHRKGRYKKSSNFFLAVFVQCSKNPERKKQQKWGSVILEILRRIFDPKSSIFHFHQEQNLKFLKNTH